jgi:formamidopyrimidine-DNA glycosylase
MPELPEVETIVRGLQPKITGKTISRLQILLPKTVWLDDIRATGDAEVNQVKALVEGKEIQNITRRGKMIIGTLSQNSTILIHLKMTGQLIFIDSRQQRYVGGHPNRDMGMELPVKATRAIFNFPDGSRLFFNDQRQFGYIKVIPSSALAAHAAYQKYGPEPFDEQFNAEYLLDLSQRRSRATIKQLILDQAVVAGVGNIYADESLFASRIHPAQTAASLTLSQFKVLVGHIKEVLRFSIEHNGTSSEHYLTASGEKGDMQDYLQVYRKDGQPCPRCGAEIQRMVIGGRGTHFCPHCQVIPSVQIKQV